MADKSGVFHPGNHEAEMCYGGVDLHKDLAECMKNPGHEGFIPHKDFNKMCLPSSYHDDDLIKLPDRPTDLACRQSQNKNKMIDQSGVFCPGNHEAEMCYGGEADLHKHVTGCEKNPGHKDFIPLKDFNTNYLPSLYHDDDLMSVTIKALAAITVQVKTKLTSLERPEFYPGTQFPYPCYNDRGSHMMRLGTGRVERVYKYTEKHRGTCRCAKCQVSATPSKVWGMVDVMTATHVVFDDSEARQTTCVLGFDDDKSPVVSLDGWEVEVGRADIKRDTCVLSYLTCDLKLIDELDKLCRRFDDLCGEVRKKYMRFADVDKLIVIVSHPHGCPKQVSVGQWTHKHEGYDRSFYCTRYVYTTCTCPGSSGAFVYRLGYNIFFLPYNHLHSGSNSEGNYSGDCWH